MTMNLTALGNDFVMQVSDRQLTHVTTTGSIHVSSDDANKAVVLSCSDALLAITFTGLGKLNSTQVDEWLLNVLQEEALCELEADIAIEKFSVLATDWFQSFRTDWSGPHTFIFAGFQKKANTNQSKARLWFVSNTKSNGYLSFDVCPIKNKGMYVTGWLGAFTRMERSRVQAALRSAQNIEQIEAALVNGIRMAASRPDGGPIGKNCMSISLAPPRIALSRFYPYGEHSHNFAPHIVWYEGGRNIAVKGIDHLTGGQYSLMFGGNACKLVVRHGQVKAPPPPQEIQSRFHIRFTNAKYHSDPVTGANIVRIIAD